jgi:hypothetical protein
VSGATALHHPQVTQTKMPNAVEPLGANPDDALPNVQRGRLSFGSFGCNRSASGRCTVQIVLHYAGTRFVGSAEGQSSPVGDMRLGAEAAMQAVEAFAQGTLGLELMGVKLIRAFDANVVIVSCTQRAARGLKLVGCFLADDDTVRGAALAVLNATNRVLGNYLTTR